LATWTLVVACSAACGPSPRPVSPAFEDAWPTTQGNAQRAAFQNETIPAELTVAWDIDAGRGLRASVLLTDSALFVATTNRQLFAFETRTGRRNWDQRVEGEVSGEIVRSGRTLFMATAEWNGRVHARDVERGKRVWRRDLGPTRFSPVVESGVVYVGTDRGFAHALRADDGEQLWRTRVGAPVAATPLSHGDALVIGTARDTLYRIAKRDGAVLARGALEHTMTAAPAVTGDTLVVATNSGAVFGLDAMTFEERWRVDTGAPVLAAPVIASNGTIHVLNRDAAIWRIEGGRGTRVAELGGAATSSFTLARDRYIVGLVNGTLLITDMTGRVVGEFKFNDSISAPVAVRAGALYVALLHGRIVKLR
jgi:outer membrane protein assembly factor BamB